MMTAESGDRRATMNWKEEAQKLHDDTVTNYCGHCGAPFATETRAVNHVLNECDYDKLWWEH